MAQFVTVFFNVLFALVAFCSCSFRLVGAAPLKLSGSTNSDTWPIARNIIDIDGIPAFDLVKPVPAMVSDVVDFAPELSADAGGADLGAEATVTRWETTTVTVQATATAIPDEVLVGPDTHPQAQWVLPEVFTDLSPFGIKRLAYGSPNIAVVTGIPATASASAISTSPSAEAFTTTVAAVDSDTSFKSGLARTLMTNPQTSEVLPRRWTNSSSAYRLFFPSGSINPGNKPQGGSDFYAAPLSVRGATNVTLQYSVFFPADFEWVQGGKLPGLYGGHGGCSGGNDAKSCFSTRMMWRQGGAGELYLYAPKDKQTAALCQAPPESVCDAAYGLSVGRGSFRFAAGDWTHVSQTVRLNTPGKQDGGFELVVNGKKIMRRDDVFYRDVLSGSNGGGGRGGDDGGGDGGDDGWGSDGGDGGGNEDGGDSGIIIGGDTGDEGGLGGLLGDLLRRDNEAASDVGSAMLLSPQAVMEDDGWGSQAPLLAPEAVPDTQKPIPTEKFVGGHSAAVSTVTVMATVTMTQSAQSGSSTALASRPQAQVESQKDAQRSIGFSGIFFSTFFGGHEPSWASPKDQYTYFKDFGMTVNG